MIKTAVIIAGGEGSRLKPLSNNKPKAMVNILGKPMLYWVLRWLKDQGVENVVIGIAYKREKILRYLADNANFGMQIKTSVHTLKGGTAQAFRLAISRHVKDDVFLAMNCDEITNMRIASLGKVHLSQKALVSMAVAPFHCRFSVVRVKPNRRISGFTYGRVLNDVLISIGIYIFDRRILPHIPRTGSIEHAVFTPLAAKGAIASYRLARDEQWISVNDIKNVREVEENPGILELRSADNSSRAGRAPRRGGKALFHYL